MTKVFQDTSAEVLVSGPAGTAKSFTCLYKIHYHCNATPGIRCLIARKFRTDLTEAALVTYEDHVLGPGHPMRSSNRGMTRGYGYPNGSKIVVAGLDQKGDEGSTKAMSAEYDIIYVQEATEISEDDWQNLTTRLRHGRLHFQQLIGDCNPSYPQHWLKVRADSGLMTYYDTDHRDNPIFWDDRVKEWTSRGNEYLERLSKLRGVKRDRLLSGKWTSAEGVVFEEFTEANIVRLEPDPFYPIEIAADDGYKPDPRAILFCQQHPDYLLVFDEQVHTGHLAEVCVEEVIEKCKYGWPRMEEQLEEINSLPSELLAASPHPTEIIWRPEEVKDEFGKTIGMKQVPYQSFSLPEIAVAGTESKDLLMRFKLGDIPARGGTHKPMTQGLELMRRLICDSRGRRRILVNQRCVNLISELMGGYRYPTKGRRRTRLDQPIDENNHCVDGLRYLLWLRYRKMWLDE